MNWLIITLIIILGSFVAQYFLSKKRSEWFGIILPTVFFVMATVFLVLNLTDAFNNVEGFGVFLLRHGSTGLFALILKIGFIYTPLFIQLVIYFFCRRRKKRDGVSKDNKELKKMMVDDLD